jgi:hypothetical protein
MKTLYESILGSTKSGAASMIDTWWKSFKNSDLYGNYSVQKIGNKFYIIIDDFSRMPHQHSISFERDDLDKLPKHLGGICWTDYRSAKDKFSVRPCNINITNVFNKKIDLSGFDYSHWQFPTLDVMVRIMFCRDVEILGLPRYIKEFFVNIERCDIEKFEVDNPLALIEISSCGDFDIERIKKTSIQKLHVDYTSFVDPSLFEEYRTLDGILYTKMPRRFDFIPKQSNKIEKLIKDNNIKELRYRATKEDTRPLSQYSSYPIEKNNGIYSIPKNPK